MSDAKATPIITIEDVRAWQTEREALALQAEGIRVKLEKLDRQLELVALVLTVEQKKELETKPQVEKDDVPTFILNTLRENGSGMTHKDLGNAMLASKYANKFQHNANSLYNAVARLVGREDAVRHDGYFYAKSVYDHHIENEIPFPASLNSNPSSVHKVIDILEKHPNGLTAGEILGLLRESPEMQEKLKRNPTYVYSLLSRMSKRGDIEREDEYYFTAAESSAA